MKTKQRRGLAAMTPERRRQIAQRGQARLRKLNLAHRFTPDEARAARAAQSAETERDTNG